MVTKVSLNMLVDGVMSRDDGASQIGLVYLGEWKEGLIIPNNAMKDKLSVWYNGQFYSVGTDTEFVSQDFDADLVAGRFVSADIITSEKLNDRLKKRGDVEAFYAVENTDISDIINSMLQNGYDDIDLGVGRSYRIEKQIKLPKRGGANGSGSTRFFAQGTAIIVDCPDLIFTCEDPSSFTARIWASGIDFQSPDAAITGTYVNEDGKTLHTSTGQLTGRAKLFDLDSLYHMYIQNCSFLYIDSVGEGVNFIQAVALQNNHFIECDTTINAKRAFAFKSQSCQYERCNHGPIIRGGEGPANPAVNVLTWTDNIVEGGGLPLSVGGVISMNIDGNYYEKNFTDEVLTAQCYVDLRVSVGDYNLSNGSITNNHYSVARAQSGLPEWSDVKINTRPYDTFVSSGNWTNSSRMYMKDTVTYTTGDQATSRAALPENNGAPLSPAGCRVSYDARSDWFSHAKYLKSGNLHTVARLDVSYMMEQYGVSNGSRDGSAILTLRLQPKSVSIGGTLINQASATINLSWFTPQGGNDFVNDIYMFGKLIDFNQGQNGLMLRDNPRIVTSACWGGSTQLVVEKSNTDPNIFDIKLKGFVLKSHTGIGESAGIVVNATLESQGINAAAYNRASGIKLTPA